MVAIAVDRVSTVSVAWRTVHRLTYCQFWPELPYGVSPMVVHSRCISTSRDRGTLGPFLMSNSRGYATTRGCVPGSTALQRAYAYLSSLANCNLEGIVECTRLTAYVQFTGKPYTMR